MLGMGAHWLLNVFENGEKVSQLEESVPCKVTFDTLGLVATAAGDALARQKLVQRGAVSLEGLLAHVRKALAPDTKK